MNCVDNVRNGDGWLELPALVDIAGRQLFNHIEIAFRLADGATIGERLATEFNGFVLREITR